jgi:hypothetical protein
MRIPKSLRLSEIESVFSELDGAASYTLSVPIENTHQATGGEAALVQAYVSWAQQEATPTCVFNVRRAHRASDLVERLPPLAAALLSDRLSIPSGDLSGDLIKSAALERLKVLQSRQPREASRGPQIEIVCADHLGWSFPAMLYDWPVDQQPQVKRASAMRDLSRLIIATTMATESGRGMTAELVEPISEAIYELFRNTDEHARFDLQGNLVGRSLRILQARRHSISAEVLRQANADAPAIGAYCQRLQPQAGRRQIHLLELSVSDSGPGLGARYAGRSFARTERAEEYQAVLECFRKSTSTKARAGAGLGLPNVVALLRKANGFMRLRTGRQSLFADLGLEQDRLYGEPPNLGRMFPERQIAPAAGTLYTLLFPVAELVG